MIKSVFLFFLIAIPQVAIAQSPLLIIKRGSDESPIQSGLESGRFEQNRKPSAPTEVPAPKDYEFKNNLIPPPKEKNSTKSPKKMTNLPKKKPASEEQSQLSEIPDSASNPAPTDGADGKTKDEGENSFVEPSLIEEFKGIFGEPNPNIQFYRGQLHPDDIRENRIELQLMPGFIYNSARSSMSYRNYSSFYPVLDSEARLWLSPFFGLVGKYGTSLGASVSSNLQSNTQVLAKHEFSEVAIQFRKFFGMSRKSNNLTYGVFYSDYKFSVPGDETSRIRLRSLGLGLNLLGRFPSTPSFSWTLGGRFEPRIIHTELQTSLNLSSGSSPESSRIGLSVGGEFKFSRHQQVILELSHLVEKNQFSGSSNIVDPETNSFLQNVSVINSWTGIQFGFRWGQ